VFRTLPVLICISLLTFFAASGRPAIADADEAFYAEAAREMVERGDWITPYFNYEHRFQKPILFYWAVAAGYVVTGVNEWTARFPAALAGLGLVMLTVVTARRWFDERTGFLAGAIVASNFGYFALARMSLPDLPLAFFVVLTTWCGLRALLDADSRRDARRLVLFAGGAAAAGMLTKGPLAVLLPILVVVVVVALEHWMARGEARATGERTSLFGQTRPSDWVWAVLLFVAIAAPWYVAMTFRHGTAYLEGFFIGDNIERFAAAGRFNEPRGWYFYIPIVIGGLLPWSAFLALAVPAGWRSWTRRTIGRAPLRCILWALVPLLFFTASFGKQPRYILPILPPIAILLACLIRRRVDAAARGAREPFLLWCGLAAAVFIAIVGWVVVRSAPMLDVATPYAAAAAAVIFAGAVAIALTSTRASSRLPVAITAASVATLLSLHLTVLAAPPSEAVVRIAARLTELRPSAGSWATFNTFGRNLGFYMRAPHIWLADERGVVDYLSRLEPVLLVIPAADLDRIERDFGVNPRRLHMEVYFNTTGMKLETLLDPDPEEALTRVLIVTNR